MSPPAWIPAYVHNFLLAPPSSSTITCNDPSLNLSPFSPTAQVLHTSPRTHHPMIGGPCCVHAMPSATCECFSGDGLWNPAAQQTNIQSVKCCATTSAQCLVCKRAAVCKESPSRKAVCTRGVCGDGEESVGWRLTPYGL